MKVVINKCYGGFCLSDKAVNLYREAKGINKQDKTFYDGAIARDDSVLINIVESLGNKADGPHAELKILEIPDDVDWVIEEYGGVEWVAETHRTWS